MKKYPLDLLTPLFSVKSYFGYKVTKSSEKRNVTLLEIEKQQAQFCYLKLFHEIQPKSN